MNYSNPLFLIPAITGPVIVLVGIYMKRFPPKKINGFYGYRTPSSMKSQDRWDHAQKYSANELIKSGLFLTFLSYAGSLFKIPDVIGTISALVLTIIMVLIPVIRTEIELKRKFGDKTINKVID